MKSRRLYQLIHRKIARRASARAANAVNAFEVLAFVLSVDAYQVSVKTFVSLSCFLAPILSLLILAHFNCPMLARRPAPAREREWSSAW